MRSPFSFLASQGKDMDMDNMIDVEYIGTKDRKEDNVSGSGLVWNGSGDIQAVTREQWAKLQRHPEIWRAIAPAVTKVSAPAAPQVTLPTKSDTPPAEVTKAPAARKRTPTTKAGADTPPADDKVAAEGKAKEQGQKDGDAEGGAPDGAADGAGSGTAAGAGEGAA